MGNANTSSAEATLDALVDAVLVCRLEPDVIEYANAAASRLLAAPCEKIRGARFDSFLPERVRRLDDLPILSWIVSRHRADLGPIRAPILRTDGVEIHQALYVTVSAWREAEYMAVILLRSPHDEQDIDPHNAGSETPVEIGYRAVFDAVPVGVFSFDIRGIVTACNDAFVAQIGTALERVIGVDLFTLPNPGIRAAAHDALEGRVGRFEGDYQPATGTRRARHRALLSPILREGRIVGGIGVVEEITERRRIEAQLAQGERMASLGRLAAGVAHEINNPLAYVRTSLELARRELERFGRDPDERRLARLDELLEHADEGVERVRVIAHDLKTFSRGDDGSWLPVDLNTVVDSAINLVWNEIRHRATLVRERENVAPVMGSESRFVQVLVNLLVNAAQAIPEGDTEHQRITVRTKAEGDRVVVEVEDTGTGIPPELLEHIFEPFWTSKPRGIGTGLGLSICHGIVAAAGGTIRVTRSRPGETTFRVDLPATSDREVIARAPATISAAPLGRRERILVVDDEAKLAATLRIALGDRFDVQVAISGRVALETIRGDADFDLVLCDLMMPDLSGMELYERVLVELPELAQRFVFMTGGAFTERADAFLREHAVRRLEKPFELEAIEALLTRA